MAKRKLFACPPFVCQSFADAAKVLILISHFPILFSLFFPQGEDSVEYFLGLTPSGIVVLRNKTTVAHYYWPRIAKVYYKGRYFMLRISDKNVNSQRTQQQWKLRAGSW